MVSALDGKGKVAFTNGAIRGINLAALVRNVKDVFLNPKAMESQKTDFAELSGTFNISNGMLHNDDLQLLSPLLRVTGKGTVDLPKQTVNYRIEPKVVASTKGQGGKADLSGLMVPVMVSGPWNNLSYRPDLAGALKQDPGKALEQLKKALPGGDKSSPSSGGGTAPNPGDAQKKLFGR
jgi:AsmA protein